MYWPGALARALLVRRPERPELFLTAARLGATCGAGHSHSRWLPRAARTSMSVGLPAPSLWP
eukprot:15484702-Alexandrium_andersonii.AAC.1